VQDAAFTGRSLHLKDIVTEIQAMASAGYQEAVLTGVHLGSYGRDLEENVDLGSLIVAILNYTNISRLRISSLEPWDIAPDFFQLWEDPRLLPHLHVPLQSGSDKILRRMARRTTRASFRSLAASARAHIPNLSLTTDLIVGFPGESEADFQESINYVREIGFSRLHVFPYSERPGTAAASMDGHIPKKIKKERVGRMTDLGRSLSLAFNRRFEGHISRVLWEAAIGADENGLRWIGYTDNYIRVQANGPASLFNRITSTRLAEAHQAGIIGEILNEGLQLTVHFDQ
jgi:threonylcarbamoyladenosine tRNA methylthiotransferase MtaB